MTKQIPMLFSTDMVRADLQGRKTETRRLRGLELVNEMPDDWMFLFTKVEQKGKKIELYAYFKKLGSPDTIKLKCPYGYPSCLLWFIESYSPIENGLNSFKYKYKADFPALKMGWKPGLHMPVKAARLWKLILDIRVERLKDITVVSALEEGIDRKLSDIKEGQVYYDYTTNGFSLKSAVTSYFTLWQKINGKESLDLNPWVWVIKYKATDKPENNE